MNTKITAPNEISSYFQCGRCLTEKPAGISAKDYARTQAGVTSKGEIQVWCNRHDLNVVRIGDLSELQHLIGACDAKNCAHSHQASESPGLTRQAIIAEELSELSRMRKRHDRKK